MAEIEKKYKTNQNFDELADKLSNMGFIRKKLKSHQIDSYWLSDYKRADGVSTYLRFRQDLMSDKYSFDYHEIISNLSTKETEIEISKDSLRELTYIIKCLLGQDITAVVDKTRLKFTNGEAVIVLDDVKNLGTFVEIEFEGDDEVLLESKINALRDSLGLSETDLVTGCGYPDLIIKKGL